MQDLGQMKELNIGLLVFAALVTLFLLIGSVAEHSWNRPFMKSFVFLLIANITIQLGEAGIWILEGKPENIPLMKLCCFLSFGIGSVMITLVSYCIVGLVREQKKVSWLPAHSMAAASIVMVLASAVSVFNGMFFDFDGKGMLVDGPLCRIVSLFDLITFFIETLMIAGYRRYLSVRGILSLLSFCVFQLAAMLLEGIWYPTPEYLMTTLSLIVLFMLFHGEITRQLAEKERQLTESRIAIMMSQIKPHFLYNSLTSIYQLCDINPAKAQQAIGYFAKYLRGNLDSIGKNTLIPLEEEMQHVENYLNLEKMRYGNRLEMIYYIENEQFCVPALSIQPLVENAVKHGIGKKKKGGRVVIAAWETPEAYRVTVADNGMGYDSSLPPEDQHSHVGVENVRERLRIMCQGTLEITSAAGEGTTASITIPKGE